MKPQFCRALGVMLCSCEKQWVDAVFLCKATMRD